MKYKILVVDDETHSRKSLCTCFPWKQAGFEVTGQCENGQEALAFLKENQVHVLLCDICMPKMDGIELSKILNTWKNPPVIVFFSGYRDFEYAQQAVAYGVRFYILKPVQFEKLMEALNTVKLELDRKYHVVEALTNQEDIFIAKVNAYIEKHLDTANLTELSQHLYMNSSYVSQLYKQKTGRNFSDYLLEVRMEKAAELLRSTPEKIYNISKSVGYGNWKNFSKAFQSYFGLTPSAYRNERMGDEKEE